MADVPSAKARRDFPPQTTSPCGASQARTPAAPVWRRRSIDYSRSVYHYWGDEGASTPAVNGVADVPSAKARRDFPPQTTSPCGASQARTPAAPVWRRRSIDYSRSVYHYWGDEGASTTATLPSQTTPRVIPGWGLQPPGPRNPALAGIAVKNHVAQHSNAANSSRIRMIGIMRHTQPPLGGQRPVDQKPKGLC